MKNKLFASLIIVGAMAASASAEVVAVSLSTKLAFDVYTDGAFVKEQSSAGSQRGYLVFEINDASEVVGTPTLIYYYTEKDSNNKIVKGYVSNPLDGLHYNTVKKGQLIQIFGGVNVFGGVNAFGDVTFTGVANSKGSLRTIKLDPLISQTASSDPTISDPKGTVENGGNVERITSSGNGSRLALNSKVTTGDQAVTELINRLEKQGYKPSL